MLSKLQKTFRAPAPYYSDGYKVGHKRMLAALTTFLYGTWIPRSLKYAPKGVKKILSIGHQLTVRWLHAEWQENFFDMPKDVAVKFGTDMAKYLGMPYDASHFEALHDLGYLPIKIKALPEGIETDPNVPHMTFINTVPGFAWLTLYLETIISSLAWKPATSATIALQYRRNLVKWVAKTDPANAWLIPYLCHDFSARGLSPWDSLSSGLGHAFSFQGSDSIIVIPGARYFYDVPEDEVCIASVNASEHSVSTTKIFTVGEEQMMIDWLTDFNEGIFSMVADTFDVTLVAKPGPGGFCYNQKELIMNRNGKLVIRPDSGDPVEILCGHGRTELTEHELKAGYPEFYTKGLIECLWETFDGTINEQGYKVLDPHIGAIYGDSITLDRQIEIYERLEAKGFACTNIVLGVGSFTYQCNTRDTLGYAAKGAWFENDGRGIDIYKEPVTDDGTKKSLKGKCAVFEANGVYVVQTQCTEEEENTGLLQVIYENGNFHNQTTMAEIRAKIDELSKIAS
jgi:nicotinamide phosphoribosyltransferase